MVFKRFQIIIWLYLLLLLSGTFGLIYYSYIELNYIRLFFLSLFELIVLWSLFSYINRTNRDLSSFLNATLHNDFSIKYSHQQKGKSYQELYEAFNGINDKFIALSQNEASEYQYIVSLIKHMPIGILIYDKSKRIHLVNQALKELLKKDELIDLYGIKQISPSLFAAINELTTQERRTIKIELDKKHYDLSLAASEMKLRDQHYTIISIQDIKHELDSNEMLAWQKLIRVLTHEIMNSVSPITSLSGSLGQIVKHQPEQLSQAEMLHLKDGLDAIENRSKGLLAFTDAYRKLTKVPLIDIQSIEGVIFFARIARLFESNLPEHIVFEMNSLSPFSFQADPVLLEQVIINILKNSMESIANEGWVSLKIKPQKARLTILISDNGGGIPNEIKDKVFVPFYTTKQKGSGIGLSLSRQIIHQHKGSLTFESQPKGTTFKIEL